MVRDTDELSGRVAGDHAFVEKLVLNETGHRNMLQLIQLRWVAVLGQVLTIIIAHQWFGIALPILNMFAVLLLLVVFNIGSHLRWHEEKEASNRALFFSLLLDVGSLTAQLYFSGGTSNPFVFLFLLQVILAAILLRPVTAWFMMVITSGCVAALSVNYQPLVLPVNTRFLFANLYFQGLLVCFALVAALLVFFITRISSNLRAGDAYLASLRQRAAEEDHIVRMGLLASGAAHELGTPLSTMSVILSDWKRMPLLQDDAGMQADLDEVQTQLLRCKSIVSGILLSAGETRGEFSTRTTLRLFVDGLVDEWRGSRGAVVFEYEFLIDQDLDLVSDSMLKQMIFNVLDNAVEASPEWVALRVYQEQGLLNLQVLDRGPGFAPGVLDHFGRPYNSTKGKPGRGLGLFLVVNVARTLGGTVRPYNREHGGAGMLLSIPLRSIALPEGASDVE